MFTYQKGIIRTSVRRMVEFLLRSGDIRTEGAFVSDVEAMQAGSRIHRKIQKQQNTSYQAEIPLKMNWREEGYEFVLEGRADGLDHVKAGLFTDRDQMTLETWMERQSSDSIDEEKEIVYIDEIKGVYQNIQEMKEAKALHLAQARCYAAMYMIENHLELIGVQITYCNMETEHIRRFHHIYEKNELETWFLDLIDRCKMWAGLYVKNRNLRQTSITDLVFPFSYRTGQKKMIAMVYQSIVRRQKVFFQAPTGVGKTISTIYPSLKSFIHEDTDKIYYLTAKTITRTVAEDTLQLLKKQGLRLKSVTLTAREKICPWEVCQCDPEVCPYAKGHYDRINGALYELLLQEDSLTRERILSFSEDYEVCPYQLAFEAAAFADFVICDYNYVFDPHVNRNRLQAEETGRANILLIDEAHNLVERARTMYSADLSESDLSKLRKLIPSYEKKLRRKLDRCRRRISIMKKHFLQGQMEEEYSDIGEKRAEDRWNKDYEELEDVDGLYLPLMNFLEEFQEYLQDHPVLEQREEMVDAFFLMRHFLGIMETMTEGYRYFAMWTKAGYTVRLFCIDPSAQLKSILDQNKASIFFSATLLPMPYYRNLLYGEEAEAYAIESPYDDRKRMICIAQDVTSRYTRRNESEYEKIIRYIQRNLKAKAGHYMVFFPSYEMMEQVYQQLILSSEEKEAEYILQESGMGEEEREEFLARFAQSTDQSLVGFCVLGSIFSEGIDLSGDKLIGVLIVGTGLPKVGMERDMIRGYFDRHDRKGYDYAYRYPGMNKVLQAAGRVIRSMEDVGVITLLDERFLWRENQYLLPTDWKSYYEVNLNNYTAVLDAFWDGMDN